MTKLSIDTVPGQFGEKIPGTRAIVSQVQTKSAFFWDNQQMSNSPMLFLFLEAEIPQGQFSASAAAGATAIPRPEAGATAQS